MKIYNNKKGKFEVIKEKSFKNEKDIQKLFENNLDLIMGLEFVKSEFTIKNKRIDTLAFDKKSKSFIIIEYKNDLIYSVVDQGIIYLNLMNENKEAFILYYKSKINPKLNMEDVDWKQNKLLIVAPEFSDKQIEAAKTKLINIEIQLWEIKQLDKDFVIINQIKNSNSSGSRNKKDNSKSNSNKVEFSEEDHIIKGTDKIKKLYTKFKKAILKLNKDITIYPQQNYIAFKKDKNITDICIQKNKLKLFINLKKGFLKDPKKIMKDVSGIGRPSSGDYQIEFDNDENLEYIMSLIKQAIN